MSIKNNMSQVNPDLSFLIACCQVNPSTDDLAFIHSHLSDPNINLNAIRELANLHGVLPLLYDTLKKLPLDSQEPFLKDLKTSYLLTVQKNMLMSAELIFIIKLFEKNGIQVLAFKGPTLSQNAYGDITLRQFGDLDILIKRKDCSRMVSLLLEAQYIPEVELNKENETTYFGHLNVIGFHKASTGIRIEVHWELLSKNYAIDWKEKTLWIKKDKSVINNYNVPVLGLEQMILYLCVHGAKHLFERLEWICDIDRSVRANPDIDWQQLIQEAEKLGIKRMLFLGLTLSQKFFKLELPSLITRKISEDEKLLELISKIIETNFSETVQIGKSYSSFGILWSMREKRADRLRFAWYGLFAPKFDDFQFIQLPEYLTFLYPILRPYRLIRKYFEH